jgi:hypothetical protein
VPLLLRGLKKIERWKPDSEDISWLSQNDFPAEPLIDLIPDSKGKLSVWEIEDDESNLDRVLAAQIATKDNLKPYPYLLVDLDVIVDAGIELDRINGTTPDHIVNSLHRDIVKLSATMLVQLGRVIWRNKKRLDEVSDWDAESWVRHGIDQGHIDRRRLNRGMARHLNL